MSSRSGGARRGGNAGVPASAPVVSYSSDHVRQRIASMVGHPPPDAEIAALTGLRGGAGVQVSVNGGGFIRASSATAHGQRLSEVYLDRDPQSGQFTLRLHRFADGSGREVPLDAHVIARQASAARALGITEMAIKGRSGTQDDLDLLRKGFDTPIHLALRELGTFTTLPDAFRGTRTLSELVSTRAGMAWWVSHRNRGYPPMFFSVRPNSQSVRRLKGYLRTHPNG